MATESQLDPAASLQWIWRLAIVVLVVYWIMLFTGTHIRIPPEKTLGVNDKALHLNGYWALGMLLALVIMLRSGPKWSRAAMVVATVAAYGAVDEWTQLLVDRDCDFYDWVADIVGGSLGLGLGAITVNFIRKRVAKSRPQSPGPHEP